MEGEKSKEKPKKSLVNVIKNDLITMNITNDITLDSAPIQE